MSTPASTAVAGSSPDAACAQGERARVNIGILTTAPTPYRLALHRRIDRELPEVRLFSMYSHDMGDQPWALDAGEGDRTVSFGAGERADRGSKVSEYPRDWAKGGRMIRWVRDHGLRAVVVGGYNDLARLRLIRWCRSAGVRVFLNADSNVHLDVATGLRAAAKRALVGWVVRRCDGILPCGNFGREYFLRYGAENGRIFDFPYEPDYALIEQLPREEIDRACQSLGLKPGRRRMVFCARMTDFKKPDMAIDAFAAIAERRPEWDLVLIGSGPMLEQMKTRVPDRIKDRVTFAGFIGEQRTISAIYRASDVFVHPSIYEPWGVVINEAVCAGMAIVAARTVGAAGELLRDGVNGRAFEPGDLAGMTKSLLDATDPANLPRYKAASAEVLADWRHRGDPVQGLRRALVATGVLEVS